MSQQSDLSFSRDGSPFGRISSGTENAASLCYSKDGSPWNADGEPYSPPPVSGHIKAVNQVDWANVKKFNGVSQSNIKTIINVEG